MLFMFLRAIFSLFDPLGEGNAANFLITVTEFFIFPVRALCDRFGWFDSLPLDIPFFITFLILSLLRTFLPIL